ncbi:MAG: glycosyltransferase, partial [Prevotella nanceiensis]|nr:glycosyltransferase [Hoylesella nanceiensis]
MTKRKKVAVYLYNLSNKYVGLGEFAHNLAIRMSAKAAELKTQHNLEFCFLVPKGMSGDYGDEVDYLVLRKWRYLLLNARLPRFIKHLFFPKVDLVHWTQQLPRIHTTISPKALVTIHDVNYFHNNLPQKKIDKRTRKINRTLSFATHLSFISQFSENDVVSRFNVHQPKRVIYNGVTDQM